MRAAPASDALPDWKRTQLAVASAVFVWFAGTNFVLPFLPLYVQELGDFDAATAAVWSGVIFAIAPLMSGLTSPVWGMVADRFGAKLALQRSLIGFTICLGAMGLATEPWHLLAARAGMGIVGGFVSAALALVSTTSPEEEIARGVGRVQSARVLGLAIGPLPGGVLADAVGFRAACFVSVAGGIVAFLVVTLLASDHGRATFEARRKARTGGRREMLTPAFLAILVVVLVTRLVERTFDPILPLVVADVGAGGLGVATATAVIATSGLVATALASSAMGRAANRVDKERAQLVSLLALALICAPLAFVSGLWQLLVLRILAGAALGTTITLAFSTSAGESSVEQRGLTMGVLGTGVSIGSSSGFFLAGALAPISLTLVFAVDSVLTLGASFVHVILRRKGGRQWTRSATGSSV